MKIEEYVIASSRTCPDLGTDLKNQLHMAIGASTETNELLDAYKKWFAYGKELDKTNVSEEIFDCFWYLVNLCRMLNIDIEKGLQTNIDKLYTRYPEKFTEYHANNRDLEKERRILAAEKIIKKYESPNQSVLGNDRTSRVSNEEKDLEIKQHPPFP